MAQRKALGRGLSALLGTTEAEPEQLREIDVDRILPNADQPRRVFDEDALNELADSIRIHGIIQPIIVHPLPDNFYQLIAGERRLRAAQKAGLSQVPVHIVDFNDQQVMEAALVENLQRADLNPIEKAHGFKDYLDRFKLNHEELAQLVTAEVGSPISLARTLQTATPVVNFRWAADRAVSGPRGGYREELPDLASPPAASVLLREPIGVVTAITPYNYPINMISWKVAPALAAGCSVVLPPSPRGALCSIAFVRLAEEAGIPPGVLNLVPGEEAVGERLTSHPDVDMVTFTGSNHVGSRVMVAAAATNKKLVLELGGKSPTLILPGTEVATAVAPSMLRF